MTPSDAQKIILALAAGVDPDTGQSVEGVTLLNKPDVVRALVLAARALDANVQQTPKNEPPPQVPKAGVAWTRDEDESLLRAFDNGEAVTSLARTHGRTPGAITSRLAKHGRISTNGTETAVAPTGFEKDTRTGIQRDQAQRRLDARECNVCRATADMCWRIRGNSLPKRGVRIGETGVSIRGKILHDIRWFQGMHAGTEKPEQLKRTIPIAKTAKEHGASGFAFYVVSDDPRLTDKQLRQDCERHLFKYLEEHPDYDSWNHQTTWR